MQVNKEYIQMTIYHFYGHKANLSILQDLHNMLTIFTDSPLLLNLLHRHLFSHPESLSFHFLHNFPSFLIIKLIKLILLSFFTLPLLLFSLLFLLHDYFITHNFLHYRWTVSYTHLDVYKRQVSQYMINVRVFVISCSTFL